MEMPEGFKKVGLVVDVLASKKMCLEAALIMDAMDALKKMAESINLHLTAPLDNGKPNAYAQEELIYALNKFKEWK
jgi:hypothetical protein